MPALTPFCLALPHTALAHTQKHQLLELVREEVKGCTDVPRLHAAAGVLCQLAGGAEPVRSAALRSALILLANRYPKVGRGGWLLQRPLGRPCKEGFALPVLPRVPRACVPGLWPSPAAVRHSFPPPSLSSLLRCGATLRSSSTPCC